MKPDAGGGRPGSRRARGAALLAIWAMLTCSSAWAVNTCTVAAQPHSFNPYDTVNAATGTSPITVTCSHSDGTPVTFAYVIALSSGPGSYAARQMTGTGDTLTYNLYTTAAAHLGPAAQASKCARSGSSPICTIKPKASQVPQLATILPHRT